MGGDLGGPSKYFHREAQISDMYPLTICKDKNHLQGQFWDTQPWHWNKTEKLPLCKTGSCFSYTLCNCFHQCYRSVVSLMGRCYPYSMHGAFLHTCQQLPKGCYDSGVAVEGFAAFVLNAELPELKYVWPGWPKNLQLHLFLSEVTVLLKPKEFLKQCPPCP